MFHYPTRTTILFAGQIATILHSADTTSLIHRLFEGLIVTDCDNQKPHLAVYREGNYYILTQDAVPRSLQAEENELAEILLRTVAGSLARRVNCGPAMSSTLLAHNDTTFLVAGLPGTGKSLLTAWLIEYGCTCHSDTCSCLVGDQVLPLKIPMAIHNHDWSLLSNLENLQTRVIVVGHQFHLIAIREAGPPINTLSTPSFVIFPFFSEGSPLSIDLLPPARGALKLMECVVNSRQLSSSSGFTGISALARKVPMLQFSYGKLSHLSMVSDQLVPMLCRDNWTTGQLHNLLKSYTFKEQHVLRESKELRHQQVAQPLSMSPSPRKKLCIGMATYDDFDGVYFTVQSIRLYHPDVTQDIEIIVLDNHPTGDTAAHLKELEKSIPGYRYIPYDRHGGTAVRDIIFRMANAEFVMCLDCHVLLVPGALKKLIDYCDLNDIGGDLLQGPLLSDDLLKVYTHFASQWRMGMYGTWQTDSRYYSNNEDPFEIPMQGLGLFCCRKEAWPGFNPRFRGFGGEEGYLHEKFRQRGGRTLCLPFLKWMHRFARPIGTPYQINWKDRITNYLIGFQELGLDCTPIYDHFNHHLGEQTASTFLHDIAHEQNSTFFYFDAIYCLCSSRKSFNITNKHKEFADYSLGQRLRYWPHGKENINAVDQYKLHRQLISEAQILGLEHFLVIDENLSLPAGTARENLEQQVAILAQSVWQIANFSSEINCIGGHTCIAYHKSIYRRILQAIPEDDFQLANLITISGALPKFLKSVTQ